MLATPSNITPLSEPRKVPEIERNGQPRLPILNQREQHLGRLIKNIISVMHITSTDARSIIEESSKSIRHEFPFATNVLEILDSNSYTQEDLFEAFKSEIKKKHL